jgi:hypothetical protein
LSNAAFSSQPTVRLKSVGVGFVAVTFHDAFLERRDLGVVVAAHRRERFAVHA